eukprot:1178614-Prorocentrum_minimum.AAC.1
MVGVNHSEPSPETSMTAAAKYYEVVKIFPKQGLRPLLDQGRGHLPHRHPNASCRTRWTWTSVCTGNPLVGRHPVPQRPHNPEGRRHAPRALQIRTCTLPSHRRPH